MPRRKRSHDEVEASDPPTPPQESPILNRIRNMWEFACVNQFIFTFGKAVKIEEGFDIKDFETACIDPSESKKLDEIGLTLLKWISSVRTLTLDNWDEYTRRQFAAKSPNHNPYGTEEDHTKFRDFSVYQKIRILHQLTVWTMWNPDRLREKMPETTDKEQTAWRMEELGWDEDENSYYVLDDSRLYRKTEPPIPSAPKAKPKPKSNTLKAQAARRRASKRRKVDVNETMLDEGEDQSTLDGEKPEEASASADDESDTFGGYKWECIAITTEQYEKFLATIEKADDPNEKALRLRIIDQVLPVVQNSEEAQKRKEERKQKELFNSQRVLGAKRSSRLAGKQEREREEREVAEAAQKHKEDLAAAHREEERLSRIEEDRESRRMTREQRKKDRDYKKILAEEELEKMTEEAKRIEAGESRVSERSLKAQIEKHRRDLEELSADDWVFDCSGCGMHGKNIDDGAHSVACDQCTVWQHSKCLKISQSEAEKKDFHFICKDCKRKDEEAKRPQIKIRFRAGLSTSPPQLEEKSRPNSSSPTLKFMAVEVPEMNGQNGSSPGQNQPSKQHQGLSPVTSKATLVPSPYSPHFFSGTTNGQKPQKRALPSDLEQATRQIDPKRANSGHSMNYSPEALANQANGGASSVNGHQPGSETSSHPVYAVQPPFPQVGMNGTANQPNTKRSEESVQFTAEIGTPVPRPQGRLPSPILNRPRMSPTQGNVDVGPVAGVPSQIGATISKSERPSYKAPNMNGQSRFTPSQESTPLQNGAQNMSAQPLNNMKAPGHNLSGLSPTKHSPSISTPISHMGQTYTKPQSASTGRRSISDTSIFPPPSESQVLKPGPGQLNTSPVPTPSKPASPPTAKVHANAGISVEKRVS